MSQTDPEIMRVIQEVEDQTREKLIERAATEGLTPAEVQRAMTVERHWKERRHDEPGKQEN
jgi:hypothetical protein